MILIVISAVKFKVLMQEAVCIRLGGVYEVVEATTFPTAVPSGFLVVWAGRAYLGKPFIMFM